ncbi:MAG: hypothetical protein Q7U75_16555, partial [Desulfobacterales bacterium]|nr:hypothetical protein [Desulfobacterales bacterium]
LAQPANKNSAVAASKIRFIVIFLSDNSLLFPLQNVFDHLVHRFRRRYRRRIISRVFATPGAGFQKGFQRLDEVGPGFGEQLAHRPVDDVVVHVNLALFRLAPVGNPG